MTQFILDPTLLGRKFFLKWIVFGPNFFRQKQYNNNNNHSHNLMGFDTIEINLVLYILFSLHLSEEWRTIAMKHHVTEYSQ